MFGTPPPSTNNFVHEARTSTRQAKHASLKLNLDTGDATRSDLFKEINNMKKKAREAAVDDDCGAVPWSQSHALSEWSNCSTTAPQELDWSETLSTYSGVSGAPSRRGSKSATAGSFMFDEQQPPLPPWSNHGGTDASQRPIAPQEVDEPICGGFAASDRNRRPVVPLSTSGAEAVIPRLPFGFSPPPGLEHPSQTTRAGAPPPGLVEEAGARTVPNSGKQLDILLTTQPASMRHRNHGSMLANDASLSVGGPLSREGSSHYRPVPPPLGLPPPPAPQLQPPQQHHRQQQQQLLATGGSNSAPLGSYAHNMRREASFKMGPQCSGGSNHNAAMSTWGFLPPAK